MLTIGSTNTGCSEGLTGNRCALIKELQQSWTEIGESEAEKGNMLMELEKDCLAVYGRKIDEAANAKACLLQSIAAKEAEIVMLMMSLGEINTINPMVQSDRKSKSLKVQLAYATQVIEELELKKEERIKQIMDIKAQIKKITSEISGYDPLVSEMTSLNLEEQDLSSRKLKDYQSNLRALQKEKSERLQKVMRTLNEVHTMCGVLGLDFVKTVSEVHPCLHGTNLEHFTNISNDTLEGLDQAILNLRTERKIRREKLKDVAELLFELWNLLDTKNEEKVDFLRITSVLNSSESEILQPGALSMDVIDKTIIEVERLDMLKASRLKELVLNKRSELEDIYCKAHIQPDESVSTDKINALIESGLVDPCEILANMETHISNAKAEVSSRKDIMDKIDRWSSVCDEENWLEDYNRDENRYSAGKGVHINLKRAERARITISKIPVMIDNLIKQTLAWENERKKQFFYDGVLLTSILENYKLNRLEKEQEKKQARDHKKLQNMLLTEKESIYGSKPSPSRSNSFRSVNGSFTPSPRRNSAGSENFTNQTPRSGRQNGYFKEMRKLSTTPLNFVSISKEDTMSFSPVYGSDS